MTKCNQLATIIIASLIVSSGQSGTWQQTFELSSATNKQTSKRNSSYIYINCPRI